MKFNLKNIVIGVIFSIIIILIIDALRVYALIKKSKTLVDSAIPYEQTVPNAETKILVLGDSTAWGTGAENPKVSTAGRLGAIYPEAELRNLSQNGLRLKGLNKILDAEDPSEHFDIILVQIGANDIIRFTSMGDIELDAEKVFRRLSKQTDKLIVLHSGDVGEAKFFPFYLRPILSKRSYKMREIYKKFADQYGASYVDLISAPSVKVMDSTPALYYASDWLHLNGAGYGLWFEEIKKSLVLNQKN